MTKTETRRAWYNRNKDRLNQKRRLAYALRKEAKIAKQSQPIAIVEPKPILLEPALAIQQAPVKIDEKPTQVTGEKADESTKWKNELLVRQYINLRYSLDVGSIIGRKNAEENLSELENVLRDKHLLEYSKQLYQRYARSDDFHFNSADFFPIMIW